MKLTKTQLKKIIKEEIEGLQNEGVFDWFKGKKEKPTSEPEAAGAPETPAGLSDEEKNRYKQEMKTAATYAGDAYYRIKNDRTALTALSDSEGARKERVDMILMSKFKGSFYNEQQYGEAILGAFQPQLRDPSAEAYESAIRDMEEFASSASDAERGMVRSRKEREREAAKPPEWEERGSTGTYYKRRRMSENRQTKTRSKRVIKNEKIRS